MYQNSNPPPTCRTLLLIEDENANGLSALPIQNPAATCKLKHTYTHVLESPSAALPAPCRGASEGGVYLWRNKPFRSRPSDWLPFNPWLHLFKGEAPWKSRQSIINAPDRLRHVKQRNVRFFTFCVARFYSYTRCVWLSGACHCMSKSDLCSAMVVWLDRFESEFFWLCNDVGHQAHGRLPE